MSRQENHGVPYGLLLAFLGLGFLLIVYQMQQGTLSVLDRFKLEFSQELRAGLNNVRREVELWEEEVKAERSDLLRQQESQFLRPKPKPDVGEERDRSKHDEESSMDEPEKADLAQQQPVVDRPPKTWVSNGICYSGNVKILGKANFPYLQAANLSSRLWHRLTDHDVILHVVYEAEDEGNKAMLDFAQNLRRDGTQVELVGVGPGEECVLKAKFLRMFAHRLPYVRDDDFVVTSDVDAFVVDRSIFDVLKEDYKLWIFQYSHTVQAQHYFPECFIAMRASMWRDTLEVDTPKQLMDKYAPVLDLPKQDKWYYDQLWISRVILEKRLCWVPANNKIWPYTRLQPPAKPYDDNGVCFHGMDYKNCHVLSSRCRWMHFRPSDKEAVLLARYNDILKAQKRKSK